jgi:hypothetical protein
MIIIPQTEVAGRHDVIRDELGYGNAALSAQYADSRLAEFWGQAAPAVREQLRVVLTGMNETSLAQLDQFTVGLHTSQPDGWTGARIVVAIRNNTAQNGQASPHSYCLSVALNPLGITASVCPELRPIGQADGQRFALAADEILPFLQGCRQRLQHAVDVRMQMRKVNRRRCQRLARRPCDYDPQP